jgi:putative methyltransferase (TIGR04325 family)
MSAARMGNFARMARISAHVPILRQVLDLAYKRRFNLADGQIRLFRGIYPDFVGAARAVPKDRLEGYDNEQSADRVAHERRRICAFDYPIMFWLSKLLPQCKLLFDWGGNVGISYFGYRGYLSYPKTLTWLICDVPAVTAFGETIASEEATPGLQFTTTLDRIAGADVLLAAGALQFIEDPLRQLRAARSLPQHILINKLPVYELPSSVTLHNMGSAFCPYHLLNRTEFLSRFEELGYRLVDEWKCPELSCEIPFFPRHSIAAYTGFYLTKQSSPASGNGEAV